MTSAKDTVPVLMIMASHKTFFTQFNTLLMIYDILGNTLLHTCMIHACHSVLPHLGSAQLMGKNVQNVTSCINANQ